MSERRRHLLMRPVCWLFGHAVADDNFRHPAGGKWVRCRRCWLWREVTL